MNISDINRTIIELKNDDTTFENCGRLASLYIVKKYFSEDETINELTDILPQYKNYMSVKKKYQLGEISEKAVERQIKLVCKEISEFIHSLYSSTDLPIERELVKNMVNGLQNL